MFVPKTSTKKRLSYLFGGDKEKNDLVKECESFKDHIEHISKFLNCIVEKPLLSDRILDNYSIVGKGQFGKVLKSDIVIEELKENYTVVLKDNINYIEDINEIFINQVRINPEIIYNNNPNFPLMISYILCHPNPTPNKMCQESILDIEKYDLDDINMLLKKNIIKLYGIYEYINGKTLLSYISTLKFLRLSEKEKWDFIKNVLIQVFSALQSLTNTKDSNGRSQNYTHYDLHMGNIMIEDEPLNYTYKLTDQDTLSLNTNFKCFIIDQGLSNVEYDGNIFIYDNNSLNKPFLHSFDIFKLISKLYTALANDNTSINTLYCKKLRSLLKLLFNNENNNENNNFIIPYINSNSNGDITLYWNWLLTSHTSEDIKIIYETIINMSYNDLVQTLLLEDELLDISKEEDIIFIPPRISSPISQLIPTKRKPIPIIIKNRK